MRYEKVPDTYQVERICISCRKDYTASFKSGHHEGDSTCPHCGAVTTVMDAGRIAHDKKGTFNL